MFNNIFENCSVYDIMWCSRAGEAMDDYVIRSMRVACWTTKATDTHSEYVIFYLTAIMVARTLPKVT